MKGRWAMTWLVAQESNLMVKVVEKDSLFYKEVVISHLYEPFCTF
jgi:hypothetical protein